MDVNVSLLYVMNINVSLLYIIYKAGVRKPYIYIIYILYIRRKYTHYGCECVTYSYYIQGGSTQGVGMRVNVMSLRMAAGPGLA